MKKIITIVCLLFYTFQSFAQCDKADYTVSSTTCKDQNITFTNTSLNVADGSIYEWDFKDGSAKATTQNVTHTFSNTGTFQVELTRTCPNNQKETKTISVTVNPKPTPNNFTNSAAGCSENAVSFFTTSPAVGMKYAWNFGDPSSASNTSNARDTSHIFEAYGIGNKSHTVTLTTTDAKGCFASTSNSVSVKERPDLDVFETNSFKTCIANLADGVSGKIELFNMTTSPSKASVTQYRINWGDGSGIETKTNATFDNISGITHTYTTLNRFPITLEADGSNGCKTTNKYFYLVDANPVANLDGPPAGANVGCGPLTVSFTNKSSNVSSTTKFFFTPGDGTPPIQLATGVTGNTITYTYFTSCLNGVIQSLTAKLKAENECDSATSTWSPIRIFPQPVAKFVATKPYCKGSPITFTNNSIPNRCAANGNTKYTWDFGDGTSPEVFLNVDKNLSPQQTLTHTYADTGTYIVVLKAENSSTNGCGFTLHKDTIKVSERPTADFTPSIETGCAPLKVLFTNKSKGINVGYNWSVSPSTGTTFVNGTLSSSLNPEIQFANEGTFVVTLIATTPCGTDTHKDTITVKTKPSVAFPAAPAAQCFPATFTESSFLPTIKNGGGTISNHLWNFSGGTSANTNTANPGDVTFSTSALYPIIVSITNECGTSKDTAKTFFNVGTPPVANAGKDTAICSGNAAQLGEGSKVGFAYEWSPATGLNSTIISNPTTTLTNAGAVATTTSYTVKVTANGCSSTKTVKVQVNPFPTVSAGNDSSMCKTDTTFQLLGATPAGGTWTTTAFLDASGKFNTTGLAANVYTAEYTFKDALTKCQAIKTKKLTINPLPIVEAGTNKVFCNTDSVETLTGFSPLIGTWSGLGVTASGDFTPSAVGIKTGHKLFYKVVDVNTCTAIDSLLINVTAPSSVAMGLDEKKCLNNNSFILANPNPTGGTWKTTPFLTSAGNFDLKIAGSDTFTVEYTSPGTASCQAKGTKKIIIHDTLSVEAGADQDVCLNEDKFKLTGFSPAGGTWSSTPATFVSGNEFDPAKAGAAVADVIVNLTYKVTDVITTCSSKDIKTITIKPVPIVDLTGVASSFCTKDTTFDLGALPTSGTWTGAGIVGNKFNPKTAGVGSHKLKYKVATGNCSDEDSVTVTITPLVKPTAGSDFDICIDAAIKTLSGFSPASGTWLGAGMTSNTFNPAVAGVDTFDLVYQTGIGTCRATDTLKAAVNPLPVLSVGTATQGVCEGAPAFNLTGWSPTTGGTFAWTGTGITNATLATFDPVVAGSGSFLLTLTYKNTITSCENSKTKTINVNALPILDYSLKDSICILKTLGISNTSTGVSLSYQWILNPTTGFTNVLGTSSTSPNPSYSFTTSGTYEVKLLSETGAGCTDSLKKQVVVLDPPIPKFSVDKKNGCGPLTVAFTNLSTGVLKTYAWNFGNGQTSTSKDPSPILFAPSKSQDTTYYIRLKITSPTCDDVEFLDSVVVFPKPFVVFGSDKNIGCSPAPIQLKNNTIGRPDSFIWNYGDGTANSTTSEGLHTHFFRYLGKNDTTYTVTLSAFNACGSDSKTLKIKVLPNTVKAFFNTDVFEGCVPLTVNFTNLSSGGSNIKWDLGDGNVTSTPNPSNIYTTAGEYFVTLFVNNGCSFDTTKPAVKIKVNPSPIVKFNTSTNIICQNNSIDFLNTSIDIKKYTWDFGDGSATTTLTSPKHTFLTNGTFKIILTGQSATTNCFNKDSATVSVSELPKPAFTTDVLVGCQPLKVNINNTSTNSATSVWNFADGNTSGNNSTSFDYEFLKTGVFKVKLVSTSPLGCIDSTTTTVEVNPKPKSVFSLSPTFSCEYPVKVQTTNTSTGVISSAWNFGNGATSMLNTPFTNYTTSGDYTVQLISISDKNCRDTATKIFNGHPFPKPAFTATPVLGCEPLVVSFQNNSLFATDFVWDFGDGASKSTSNNPVHVFSKKGIYSVKVIATGQGVCTDSLTIKDMVTVVESPDAQFSYQNENDPVPHGQIQFTNLTPDAKSYLWNFGDGTKTTDKNPSHRYDIHGEIPITLIATNALGCVDTTVQKIVIDFYKGLWVPTALSPENGNDEARVFLPKGKNLKKYKLQIYDNWGIMVWQSDKLENGSPSEAWDGTGQNGNPMPPDVYVWRVSAEFEDGGIWEGQNIGNNKKTKAVGTVTLIR